MRVSMAVTCAVGVLAFAGQDLRAEPEGAKPLTGGVRLEVAGKPIDVSVGHAAPFVVDWDGDGRQDLLVGEFGTGGVTLFRNVGAKGAPRLESAGFLKAGTADATVPSG
jgi:hypothetical protein